MNVWILQTGEPLHCDAGYPRPMRAMNLANTLIDRGHSVVIFSSAFYHQEKRHRSKNFISLSINDNLKIYLIPSCGYKNNISLSRLVDHAQLAWRLFKFLKSSDLPKPDAGFIGYPPIETASVMISWLKKHNIPTVIDVKDQWPMIFLEPFPKFFRPFVKLLLFPYFYFSKRSFRDSTVFSTMSMGYLVWMSKFADRKLTDSDMVIPLSAPKLNLLDNNLSDAKKWWEERGISTLSNRRFCFIGSFMTVFDFEVIREVASRFKSEEIDCQIVICGEGGQGDTIRSMMKGLDNVVFPGWIDTPKISVLAGCSRGALIPYKNIDNFTINMPNKVIDALAYGLPIITTLTGEVENVVESYKVGFACNSNTGRTMYDVMKQLLDNQEMQIDMSMRAMKLYESKYEFNEVYKCLANSLERLAVR